MHAMKLNLRSRESISEATACCLALPIYVFVQQKLGGIKESLAMTVSGAADGCHTSELSLSICVEFRSKRAKQV